MAGHTIGMDAFVHRQFDSDSYKGTRLSCTKEEFLAAVQAHYDADPTLAEGYAPFCKHIFMPNFLPDVTVGAVPITDDNEALLKTGYQARRPEELPVLCRWFNKEDVEVPTATYLDVILYSAEQIRKEHEAMPSADGSPAPDVDYEWGIISVKGQTVDYEIPMNPITMMRNALGVEEGGSGVALDPEKYRASVAFWEKHASLA